MARATRGRRRRRRKPKGKVYKKGLPKRALSGAIDTAIEKRMRTIARKEAQASLVHLVDRNYYWGNYDNVTNCFTGGRRIYYDGAMQEIFVLDKADINQPLNAPDADPQEQPDQKENDVDGSTQGMLTETIHGRRLTDVVKLSGVNMSLKVFVDRIPDEYAHMSAFNQNNNPDYVGESAWHQWFLREANGEYNRILPETVRVEYGIYQVFDETAPDSGAIAPVVVDLMPRKRWGFSSRLDDADQQPSLWKKKKALIKGKFTYQLRASVQRDKTINRYVRFPKPITVKFLPADQNGRQKTTSRFFFVIRTNIPHQTVQQTLDFAPFAPRCQLLIKSHYYE